MRQPRTATILWRRSWGNRTSLHRTTIRKFDGDAAPVLGDVAEHAVLDLVPLARSWREMTDANHQSGVVRDSLEFTVPPPVARAMRPTTIGDDLGSLSRWRTRFGPSVSTSAGPSKLRTQPSRDQS